MHFNVIESIQKIHVFSVHKLHLIIFFYIKKKIIQIIQKIENIHGIALIFWIIQTINRNYLSKPKKILNKAKINVVFKPQKFVEAQ